jgi:hypothetical protein
MANVKLSAAELKLVLDANFILTKNNIIAKVYELFGNLSSFYTDNANKHSSIQEEVCSIFPKISRGENQEGLPWVALDYPRFFSKEHEFSIRTFFWWGNFVSITLLLSGRYQQIYQHSIQQFHQSEKSDHWFLCRHPHKWLHHFREDYYQPLSSFSSTDIIQLPFIKIAKKIPLQQWDHIEIELEESFSTLLQLFL